MSWLRASLLEIDLACCYLYQQSALLLFSVSGLFMIRSMLSISPFCLFEDHIGASRENSGVFLD